jgi:hypothetical protein
MAQHLWIIDPDPTSAQAMRSAVDLLGPEVDTFEQIPENTELPHAVLIAGAVGAEQLERWIGQLRRINGADLLPITITGGLSNSAEALALGADHFLAGPIIVGDLVDHLGRFLSLNNPDKLDTELVESRGWPERKRRDSAAERDPSPPEEEDNFSATEELIEQEPDEAEEDPAEEEPIEVAEDPAEEEPIEVAEDPAEEEPIEVAEEPAEEEPIEVAEDPAEEEPIEAAEDPSEQELIEAAEDPSEQEPIEAADAAEDLFGLKQPEEVQQLAEKSENNQDEPQNQDQEIADTSPPTDFNADSSWGLEGETEAEEPATAGWGDDANEEAWGASPSESQWGEKGDDASWGEQKSDAWGAEEKSDSWGDNAAGWDESEKPSAPPKARLQTLGEQLVAPSPKPRAPLSNIGNLGATGLLGLLGRCGKERVSGRVNLRTMHEALALYFEEGRLVALNSAGFDSDLLQGALAQGWIDAKELAAVRHLQQRRHSSAAAVLVREGVREGSAIQKLAQETAERCLLRAANHAGGEAEFVAEMDTKEAVALGRADAVTRVIALSESLVDSALWTALIGGDDAIPELRTSPLPQDLPGRQALHQANGDRSLLELATASGISISALRIGCLAALALGQIELQRLGLASIQRSHRPDRAFERAIAQIRSGDYFAVLGLADAHSEPEVRRAFAARVTLLRLHLPSDHPRFAELYNELEEACEVLLDPDLRAQYRTANPKGVEQEWPCETS